MREYKKQVLLVLSFAIMGIIFGAIVGLLQSRGIVGETNYFVVLITLIVSWGIHIVMHEVGHIIVGKKCGYTFGAVRFGDSMWIKDRHGIRLKKFRQPLTSRKCIMIPPQGRDYEYPMMLFMYGGILMNLLLAIVACIPGLIFGNIILLVFSFAGIVMVIINVVPMYSDGTMNDGMIIHQMKKDNVAKFAQDLQFKVEGAWLEGLQMKEMPDEWFLMPEKYNYKTMSMGTVLYIHALRTMDLGNYEVAANEIEWTLENAKGLMQVYKSELQCELMFCYLMIGNYKRVEQIYEVEEKLPKYIQSTAISIRRKRQLYAYYLLMDKNLIQAKSEKATFDKIKKAHPYSGEVRSEEEKIQQITSLEG